MKSDRPLHTEDLGGAVAYRSLAGYALRGAHKKTENGRADKQEHALHDTHDHLTADCLV